MPDKTPYLGLNIPAEDEHFNIDHFNHNAQILDANIQEMQTDLQNHALGFSAVLTHMSGTGLEIDYQMRSPYNLTVGPGKVFVDGFGLVVAKGVEPIFTPNLLVNPEYWLYMDKWGNRYLKHTESSDPSEILIGKLICSENLIIGSTSTIVQTQLKNTLQGVTQPLGTSDKTLATTEFVETGINKAIKTGSNNVYIESSNNANRTISMPGVEGYDQLVNKVINIKASYHGSLNTDQTLNINGLGPKILMFPSLTGQDNIQTTPKTHIWVRLGGMYQVFYDGTNFVVSNFATRQATDAYFGLTKISDDINSTEGASTGKSASPLAVKTLSDRMLKAPSTSNVYFGDGITNKDTGMHNVAIGQNAAFSNTTGQYNVVMGTDASYSLSTYSGNVVIGYRASRAATALYNAVVIGNKACESATNNNGNSVVIGAEAASLINSVNGVGSCVIIGYQAQQGVAGVNNTYSNLIAIGNKALQNNTVYDNIGIGSEVLRSNRGEYNLGIGNNVLRTNITGHSNLGIGNGALYSNENGAYNTAIGLSALVNNISGQYNIALGYNALFNNTVGNCNIAFGYEALYNNSTGRRDEYHDIEGLRYNNIAIGHQAYKNPAGGDGIIAIGYQAMMNANGEYNDGRGSTLDSYDQIAIGRQALLNTGGNYNIGIGYRACNIVSNYYPVSSYNVAIGYNAMGNCANDSYYDGLSGSVAIGSSALYGLNFGGGNVAIGNGALSRLVGTGIQGQNATSGFNNIALGLTAGYYFSTSYNTHLTDASGSIFIGQNARAGNNSAVNQIVIGDSAIGGGNNTITLGNASITQLRCNVTSITSLSDVRSKTDIELADTNKLIDALMAIPVKRYRFKDDIGIEHIDTHKLGFIAQDVEKIFPKSITIGANVVVPDIDEDGNQIMEDVKVEDENGKKVTKQFQKMKIAVKKPKELTQDFAVPVLWGVVQNLVKRVENLEKKLNTLKKGVK